MFSADDGWSERSFLIDCELFGLAQKNWQSQWLDINHRTCINLESYYVVASYSNSVCFPQRMEQARS